MLQNWVRYKDGSNFYQWSRKESFVCACFAIDRHGAGTVITIPAHFWHAQATGPPKHRKRQMLHFWRNISAKKLLTLSISTRHPFIHCCGGVQAYHCWCIRNKRGSLGWYLRSIHLHQMPSGEVKVLIELRFPMMFIRFSYCSPAVWVGITKLDLECFSMFTPTWWGEKMYKRGRLGWGGLYVACYGFMLRLNVCSLGLLFFGWMR